MFGKEKIEWGNSIDVGRYYNSLKELGSESDSEIQLYHYTSTKVLNAILSKGAFRASNVFYLNDKIEFKMGVEVLQSIFEKDDLITQYLREIEDLNGKDWNGIFSISFSNKEDELQQWITYARESGVCIELNKNIIWNKKDNFFKLGIKSGEHSYVYYDATCFLKLAYAKGDIASKDKLSQSDINKIRYAFAKAQLEGWLQETIIDEDVIQKRWEENPQSAKNFLKLLSAYYKEERFKGEGEIRAAFLPAEKTRGVRTKIEYFEQNNGILRPYMDVYFMHNYKNGKAYSIECPIKSMTIGPGGSQEGVFHSVVHRLEYGDVKIWEYNKKELTELLQEFVYGCFQQSDICIKSHWYKKIAEFIIGDWCNRTGYKYKLMEANKITVLLKLYEEEDSFLNESVHEELSDEDMKEIRNIVSGYLENNYFSNRGIWVKRSSISYIF